MRAASGREISRQLSAHYGNSSTPNLRQSWPFTAHVSSPFLLIEQRCGHTRLPT